MPRLGPGARAEIGAAILTAAATVDTRLLRRRLGMFAAAHRRYLAAQRAVEASARQLAGGAGVVRRCNAEQDAAIDALLRALVLDGKPRRNPFRGLGVPSPAVLQRRAAARKAAALQQLAAAVRRLPRHSAATRHAARAADAAARAVAAAMRARLPLEAAARRMRLERDTIGRQWDSHLAALNRAARAAADDGAPHLHGVLFRGVRRTRRTRTPRRRRARAPRARA